MRRKLALGFLLTTSCGARSALEQAGLDGGNGTIGPSSGGGLAGPTTGGGGSAPCVGFVVDGEPFTIAAGRNATEPEVGLASNGNVFVAWLSQDHALIGDATLTPSSLWPDPFTDISTVTPSATAFVTGPGTSAPIAYFRDDSANAGLVFDVFGDTQAIAPFSTSQTPVFVAASYGGALFAGEQYGLLEVRSYTDANGFVALSPQICLETPLLAAAIPQGGEFVAVFADSAAPGQSCFAQTPQSGVSLVTMHYSTINGFSGAVVEQLDQQEPLLHLALVATNFGSWAVFQTDGSTSRDMPPISAYLLDEFGSLLAPGAGPIALTASGISTQTIAASAMGDALALAWVDSTDPSAPVIIVQRVETDGSVSASTSVPTNAAWLTGKLRMTTTADQQSLLLAWTADVNKSVGVAKVGCAR